MRLDSEFENYAEYRWLALAETLSLNDHGYINYLLSWHPKFFCIPQVLRKAIRRSTHIGFDRGYAIEEISFLLRGHPLPELSELKELVLIGEKELAEALIGLSADKLSEISYKLNDCTERDLLDLILARENVKYNEEDEEDDTYYDRYLNEAVCSLKQKLNSKHGNSTLFHLTEEQLWKLLKYPPPAAFLPLYYNKLAKILKDL